MIIHRVYRVLRCADALMKFAHTMLDLAGVKPVAATRLSTNVEKDWLHIVSQSKSVSSMSKMTRRLIREPPTLLLRLLRILHSCGVHRLACPPSAESLTGSGQLGSGEEKSCGLK